MGSALWAGISGLNASAKEMDVIGNNIANVNTVGFRAGKVFFADVLSQSLSGGASGSLQVGRGVAVADVQTQFGSGSFETTSNATDLAIDGDGFFMVKDANGAIYYTRAGAFHLNNDGQLVDPNGYVVQGFMGVDTTIQDISLKNVQSAPSVTQTMRVGVNLNSQTTAGDAFNATQTVYDSLGEKHTLNLCFRKTEENGYWGIEPTIDGSDTPAVTLSQYGLIFDSDGNLDQVYTGTVGAVTATNDDAGAGEDPAATAVLNRPGQVYQTGTMTLTRGATATSWTVTDAGGYTNATVTADATHVYIDLDGAGGTDVTLTLTGTWEQDDTAQFTLTHTATDAVDLTATVGTLANGATIGSSNVINWDLVGSTALSITGYASTSVIKSLWNDGYASGLLKSLSVGKDGTISGFFTNGQTSDIAQICLADFDDPWGLKRMGSNLFAETVTSGAAIKNVPGASGMGDITSNSLEMSNTDIATEFINMITAQKAYQASARVITTEDAIMTELMNIKR
ncbi:MAG: flagellar hook protein FlgE [Syntrophales bacterium]